MLRRYSIGSESIWPRTGFWEAVQSDHPDRLAARARFDAGTEILSSEQLVQISGNVEQRKGMIIPADITAKVSQQLLVDMGKP